MEFLQNYVNLTESFSLAFARVAGFMAFAPILGARTIPPRVKAMMAFLFASILAPLMTEFRGEANPEMNWFLTIALEASVGAAMGIVSTIVFEIIGFAGSLMDYQVGFGFINVVDPLFGANISILGFFYSFLGLLLFVIVDGHHILIEALYRSYEFIPIAGWQASDQALNLLVHHTSAIFSLGFQIAAPMVIVMFILDFSFGMLGKTVPQFQILVIGFPLKVGFGLIGLGLSMRPIATFIIGMFENFRVDFFSILASWG